MQLLRSGPGPILALVLLLLAAGQALGHARLDSSEPPEGGESASGAVVLSYSEALQPRFSDFVFHYLGDDREGSPGVDNRLPRPSPAFSDDRRQVELALPEGAEPGWYALDWEVLSVDGHTTRGVLRFRLIR